VVDHLDKEIQIIEVVHGINYSGSRRQVPIIAEVLKGFPRAQARL